MALSFTDPSLVYQIDVPLIIEASAGSGKTTILTERWVAVFVAQLAWGGLDPSQALASMAALTFSRKAAAEMKERIRTRLDELFEQGGLEDILGHLQAFQQKQIDILQSAEKLRMQKASIDDMIASAQINTIDSYILASLRQNPLELSEEAPIDPREKDLYEAEAQKITLHACINGSLSPNLQRAFAMGVALCGFGGWQEFFSTLRSQSSSMGEETFRQALLNSGFLSNQQAVLSAPDVFSLYKRYIKAPLSRLIEAMQAEVAYVKAAKGAKADPSDPYEGLLSANKTLLHSLLDLDEETFMGLFQKKLFPQYKTDAPIQNEEKQSLRDASLKEAQKLADACTDIALSLLMPLSKHCRSILETLRKENGSTSFSENTALFLKALQSGPMAEKIQSRLRYFFADEFQDTSPEQYQIFSLISRGAVPFYVGDPKQSIYGFRGADVTVFQRAVEEFRQKKWRTAILTENRRSCPSHVHFVNKIFGEVFNQGPIRYVPQVPLKEGEGRLGYTLSPDEPAEGENSPKKIKAADKSLRIFFEARAFINNEMLKGASYGEMLVLFRTKNEILEFYKYLKKTAPEIPISSSQRGDLFQSSYINPIINFLRAIDNPADELRLIGLLKSIFIRKDDRQISTLLDRARREGVPLYNVLPPEDTAFIGSYLSLKDRIPLDELISRLVKESSYEFHLEQDVGEASATLRLFIEELQNIRLSYSLSLEGFLRLIDEKGIEALEAEFSGGEGETVRLMTIHSAKGLESSCVIYICNDSDVLRNKGLFPLESGGRLAFNTFGKGLLAEEFKAIKEQQIFDEEKRLIYVALTRAKKSFYLCGLPNAPDKPSPLSVAHILNKTLFEQKAPGALVTRLTVDPRPPVIAPGRDQIIKDRYNRLKALEQSKVFSPYPRTLSVAQLLDAEYSPRNFFRSAENLSESLRDMGDDGFELAMPSPADIGTMVHAALQQFDSADAPGLNAYLRLNFPEFDSAFAEVQRLAFNYLQSPFYQSLSASATHKEKERSVQMLLSAEGSKILLRSVADLYVDGGKKHIVDYKLSLGSGLERYKRQLSYYAYLSEAAGYPVDELVLFSLKEGKEYLFSYDPDETKTAFNKAVAAALEIWKAL